MTRAEFYAHGKLLLTGEYFVLDGATALALPTRPGQHLKVGYSPEPGVLHWSSYEQGLHPWLEARFRLRDFELLSTTQKEEGQTLQNILRQVRKRNRGFLLKRQGVTVNTRLEFARDWGLGSSSTLISCLARWSGIDAFELQQATFGGSGYDIACATAEEPIFFQLHKGRPRVQAAGFYPPFAEHLYFVYLGRKQNSRQGIQTYRSVGEISASVHLRISTISRQLCETESFDHFCELLLEHEQLVAERIGLPRAQDLHFSDFPGLIKSLGAWGGDFVLAASPWSKKRTLEYFKEKGFDPVFRYSEMV